AAGWVARRSARPGPLLGVLGGVLVAVAGWLLPQGDVAPTTVLLGIGLGVGVGLAGARVGALRGGEAIGGAILGIAILAALVAVDGVHGTAWAGVIDGVAVAAVGVAGAVAGAAPRRRASGSVRVVAAVTAVLVAGVTFWIGANSPTATWFGSQVAHGSRDVREVAITFDDGPDDPYTLRIARILDEHDVKGTFFMVGKALDRRPDIARTLREDGHLLGNHSYQHDSWGWLDPGYPELERTQQAFRRRLGVCPTFYRAPHGQHTPFLAHVVGDHGMTMVGWEASAGDWKTKDARLVARRILDGVKPGSIILLHDGLDGSVTADRSVLVRAVPLILDGLERRHLKPVRLDAMLGKRGYGDHC
ncbi:MAG TPA: polysaccharide deacetylase family protein, partial [Acidimicrobiia bacterium]|nr:polysaccharide deacetylase family protein [Acidimicrobiia bacterium]